MQEGGRQEGEGDKEVLRKEQSEWPMAKEKNEHNDRYMALYTVKKNKNCLLILDAIANTPMKMIHI